MPTRVSKGIESGEDGLIDVDGGSEDIGGIVREGLDDGGAGAGGLVGFQEGGPAKFIAEFGRGTAVGVVFGGRRERAGGIEGEKGNGSAEIGFSGGEGLTEGFEIGRGIKGQVPVEGPPGITKGLRRKEVSTLAPKVTSP